jgi:hypothetical protein
MMLYTERYMKKHRFFAILFTLTLFQLPAPAREYSRWSGFGGLNMIYNSDGDGAVSIPGMQADGNPGGLLSAPSPLCGILGAEYRYPFRPSIDFAPSASLFVTRYLWGNDRALPAEIENRTAYVPSILLDASFLYHFEKNRFLFSFGGGPGILVRAGFLESGVSSSAQNPGEELDAGDQVDAINGYFWESLRWFYPMLQAGVRYRLDTGWGGGFVLRAGIPIFNAWSKPTVPFADSIMIIAALTITPPTSK